MARASFKNVNSRMGESNSPALRIEAKSKLIAAYSGSILLIQARKPEHWVQVQVMKAT
jgi:hypothetical protein